MKKKMLVVTAVVGCIAASSLCACGSVNFKYSETTTTTTTTTDANGVVTSYTETTTDHSDYPDGSCGAAAEDGDLHEVHVSFKNSTGEDLTGIYMVKSGADSWGNLLDDGDVLHDGESFDDFATITYGSDSLSYDVGVKDADGNLVEYDAMDISELDENGFTIEFNRTANGFGMHIDACYIL